MMTELLKAIHFGNDILRNQTIKLSSEEILSDKIQKLIGDMRFTLKEKSYGVAIAAPQVGNNIAVVVIVIKSTPTRPELKPFNMVLINPEVLDAIGEPIEMWEGCISSGEGDNTLYAKVPRFKSIRLSWVDENANKHEEVLEDFLAQVVQHEVDHLNGILFVDRVVDSKSYMLADEYRKHVEFSRTSS